MYWLRRHVRWWRNPYQPQRSGGKKFTNGMLSVVFKRCCVHFDDSSGDTGVSASLVLHGTPPFQVYYRVQRDKEPPTELSKTFATSRGELVIQPERSGHYIFTFVRMSDTNYKKVELKGPSIDQVIHPPAAADFANRHAGSGSNKRMISSCEGNLVNVQVDLRVSIVVEKVSLNLDDSRSTSFSGNRSLEFGSTGC